MNVIIIHGTKGSADINWFPWLKRSLETQGHAVYVPHMPTPGNQNPMAWHAALTQQAPAFTPDTVLIGHSLGATFLLHMLEAAPQPVAQTIFVAPVMDAIGIAEYDNLNMPFYSHAFDWSKISTNAGTTIILHGTNDPYVPPAHAARLQHEIGGLLNLIPNGGHLNGEAGFTEFPVLLDLID